MTITEPPSPQPVPSAIADAFTRIAQLRAAGFDLVYPERGELARLIRGRELIIVRAEHNVQDVSWR